MSLYHVESLLTKVAPHHASIKALWEGKWRKPCSMAIYPFTDAKVEDFDKVFSKLIEMDLKEPYDPEVFAAPFFPVAAELVAQGEVAEKAGKTAEASELYLRAAAVYRIARFPINRSPKTEEAWQLGKAAFMKAAAYMLPPIHEVSIPHTYGIGEETGSQIKAYIRTPSHASKTTPVPVLLFICGLDAYRTDHTNRVTKHVSQGFAVISVEIPGTGDSPAIKNDPKGPDRQWSSVFDWIDAQEELDSRKVLARGVSTGGYYAIRIAHTHRERLFAVVAQGGGSHYMFEERWIRAQNSMEYPYALSDALVYKFGYENQEEYIKDAQKKFSLLESGILDKPIARLLIINGMEDSIFPIEDSYLPLQHGDIKDARFVIGASHMGNPAGEGYIYSWIEKIMMDLNPELDKFKFKLFY